jgi:hypothetical protein
VHRQAEHASHDRCPSIKDVHLHLLASLTTAAVGGHTGLSALSGVGEYADTYGAVCLADPGAGAGDLLAAALDQVGEDVALQVVVTRLPYRPKEHRDGTDPFAAVRQLTDTLAPGQTAVVLGPADLLWVRCRRTGRRGAAATRS